MAQSKSYTLLLFLLFSTPILITAVYTYSPFSPKPTMMVNYENNNGRIYLMYMFSPYALVGGLTTSSLIFFCFWFKPISKHFFPAWAMEDKPIDITKVCKDCCLGEDCFMSPKRCGKYTFKNGKWKEPLF